MFGTKKKLMAAVVMLVISAIMMTSASYAWFTISTNPEITDLEAQVVVNENLEIALAKAGVSYPSTPPTSATNDYGKQNTWGNIIDLTAAPDYTSLNKILKPIKLTSTEFTKPYYGSDGRIAQMDNYLEHTNYGAGNLIYKTATDTYAYYVDFWVRSNVGGDLVLQKEAVNRETGSTAANGAQGSFFLAGGSTAADKALATGINIAFQNITSPLSIAIKGTAANKTDDTDFRKKFDSGTNVIVNLSSDNTPALIRMYVYLDGDAITNASASTTATAIKGTLNVQFALKDKDLKSMNE